MRRRVVEACAGQNVQNFKRNEMTEVDMLGCNPQKLKPVWSEDLSLSDANLAAVADHAYTAPPIDDCCPKLAKGGAFIDANAANEPIAWQQAGLRLWRR